MKEILIILTISIPILIFCIFSIKMNKQRSDWERYKFKRMLEPKSKIK